MFPALCLYDLSLSLFALFLSMATASSLVLSSFKTIWVA